MQQGLNLWVHGHVNKVATFARPMPWQILSVVRSGIKLTNELCALAAWGMN
jgi:hypothetical protein